MENCTGCGKPLDKCVCTIESEETTILDITRITTTEDIDSGRIEGVQYIINHPENWTIGDFTDFVNTLETLFNK